MLLQSIKIKFTSYITILEVHSRVKPNAQTVLNHQNLHIEIIVHHKYNQTNSRPCAPHHRSTPPATQSSAAFNLRRFTHQPSTTASLSLSTLPSIPTKPSGSDQILRRSSWSPSPSASNQIPPSPDHGLITVSSSPEAYATISAIESKLSPCSAQSLRASSAEPFLTASSLSLRPVLPEPQAHASLYNLSALSHLF